MDQFGNLKIDSYFVYGNCLFLKIDENNGMCVKNDGENQLFPFQSYWRVVAITEGLGFIQNYLAIEDRKHWFNKLGLGV